jgi:hypothetical protein
MIESRAPEPEGVMHYMHVDNARSSAQGEEVFGATRVHARAVRIRM